MKELNLLHNDVTKYMPVAEDRCIARVLFADPIGASDQALKIRMDAFRRIFRARRSTSVRLPFR